MLVLGPFMVLGAVIARDSLGGAGAWALILAASGLGELGGGLVALRLRPRWPLRAATWAGLLWTPQVALLALEAPALADRGDRVRRRRGHVVRRRRLEHRPPRAHPGPFAGPGQLL